MDVKQHFNQSQEPCVFGTHRVAVEAEPGACKKNRTAVVLSSLELIHFGAAGRFHHGFPEDLDVTDVWSVDWVVIYLADGVDQVDSSVFRQKCKYVRIIFFTSLRR